MSNSKKSKVRYFSLVAVFLAFLFSIKINLGCIFVFLYFCVISYVIYSGVNFVRQEIKRIFCVTYINDSSPIYKLCHGKMLAVPISILVTIPFSSSLAIFVYLAGPLESAVLILNSMLFFFVYRFFVHNSANNNLSEGSRTLGSYFAAIFVNASFLGIVYYVITYFTEPNFGIFDINLPEYVKNTVGNSCITFQHIARTALFVELNIFTFRNIPGMSEYLFAFIYAFMFSITPFLGFSFFLSKIIAFSQCDTKFDNQCKTLITKN